MRADVAQAKAVYRAVLRTKVKDDAPASEQHAWWRVHDALKREYAVADWRWESLLLRAALALALLALAAALVVRDALLLANLLAIIGVWRAHVILTRHAPD